MVWNFVVNCSDPFSLLYLLSSDNSATHLPSVWSWKGCLLWPLAFDLKATQLSWILKYFTCSPSTCNSYFSQNNGQVGSLHELIQKSETYRPKIMSDLESCQWTLQCSSTLVLNSLNGGFSQKYWSLTSLGEKIQNERKNAAARRKKTKLGVHLANRARPESPFSPEKNVKKCRTEKNRVRSSWKEIF